VTADVRFYFSFASPYSYLAHTQSAGIAAQTGARFDYQPIDLKALWTEVGNDPQTRKCPPRMAFVIADVRRWVARYQIPMEINPKALEFDSRRLLGGVFAAAAQAKRQPYIDAIFDAVWAHPKDLTTQEVWTALLDELGLDAGAFERAVVDESIQEELDASTRAAVEAKAFGAPTFIVGDQLFFGNDRLDFLKDALRDLPPSLSHDGADI
jgi:2-hydroxychromene-2-carboxylate isomerase